MERAAGYWPENPRVNFNLAIAYWQNKRVEDAVRSFEQCIRMQPDNPEFRQRVSELLAQNDRWSEALPHLRHLNALLPGRPDLQSFLKQAEQYTK